MASTRLHKEVSHAVLWLMISLGGGSIAILLLHLAGGSLPFDQRLVSLCAAPV